MTRDEMVARIAQQTRPCDFVVVGCRALFLNAAAAVRMAPEVASIMARELRRDSSWEPSEAVRFTALARQYTLAQAPDPESAASSSAPFKHVAGSHREEVANSASDPTKP